MKDEINPCDNCEIKELSSCCTAPVIFNDLCSDCHEHCDLTCDNCDFKTETK